MLACHLIVKTNKESGFANITKFQDKNPISQNFGGKIQKIQNFCDVLFNLPTKIRTYKITKIPLKHPKYP